MEGREEGRARRVRHSLDRRYLYETAPPASIKAECCRENVWLLAWSFKWPIVGRRKADRPKSALCKPDVFLCMANRVAVPPL